VIASVNIDGQEIATIQERNILKHEDKRLLVIKELGKKKIVSKLAIARILALSEYSIQKLIKVGL
jgi:hypothetical protein